MFGGIAVAGNLLCVAYTDARGKLFLLDLDDLRVVSRWSWGGRAAAYSDAGGVAMSASYTIFVTDAANDTVRRFTAFGRELESLGRPTERGPGAKERDRRGTFDRPSALAVAGDTLYIGCGDRKLVRGVQRVDLRDGRVLDHLRSFGDPEARFGAPRGIAATDTEVWVADTLHGVVQRFRRDGAFVCEVPTALDHDDVSRPVAVLPLADGSLLVADQGDHHGLRTIPIDGPPRTLANGFELDEPTALAADARGCVYVLDRHGERVQRLHPDLQFDRLIVDLAEVGVDT